MSPSILPKLKLCYKINMAHTHSRALKFEPRLSTSRFHFTALVFLQSCTTKSGMESLGLRLATPSGHVHSHRNQSSKGTILIVAFQPSSSWRNSTTQTGFWGASCLVKSCSLSFRRPIQLHFWHLYIPCLATLQSQMPSQSNASHALLFVFWKEKLILTKGRSFSTTLSVQKSYS